MNTKEKLNKINDMMLEAVDNGVFPGANYCYIEADEMYCNSFGAKAMLPKYEKNSMDTVYDIASLSKVVGTTMAVLKLVEDKKLDLYDSVSKYLPYVQPDVRIIDLCTHSSGYPALTEGTTEMTKVEPLMADLINCKQTYELGSQVVYSDVGFMYLGFVVEKLTGSMPDYLYKTCFELMGMYDTRYNHKEIMRIAPTESFGFRGMIRGFCHDEKCFLLDGVAGHAGLYSTVEDLSKFAQMLLNKGYYKDQKILSESSMAWIQKPLMKSDDDHRSIGWIVRTIKDHPVIYHTGYTGTSMLVDVEENKAFILLSNRVHPTRNNTKIIAFRKKIEEVLYA